MRYTVLTYIFNNYEVVHEVEEKDPDAEYVLVTDDRSLMSSTWKVVHDDSINQLSPFGKCYEVRFHPFRYASTDTVVRIDGSIGVKRSLAPVMDAFEAGGYDRCLMIHPTRNTMPDEYDVWVRTRNYPRAQADRCLSLMRKLGYDMSYRGLYQGCFEIVRNIPINRRLNELTFDFLKYLGYDGRIERIDQTVSSFLANTLFDDMKVMPVSEDLVTNGRYMQWYIHKSNRPIFNFRKVRPYLFDKEIKTIDF